MLPEIHDVAQCCVSCTNTSKCTAFTVNASGCALKNTTAGLKPATGSTSGVLSPPSPPPPPPCPPGKKFCAGSCCDYGAECCGDHICTAPGGICCGTLRLAQAKSAARMPRTPTVAPRPLSRAGLVVAARALEEKVAAVAATRRSECGLWSKYNCCCGTMCCKCGASGPSYPSCDKGGDVSRCGACDGDKCVVHTTPFRITSMK